MPPQPHQAARAHPPSAVPLRPVPLEIVPVTLAPDVVRLVTVLAQIERRRQLRRQRIAISALQEAS
jgi:hypothetical protein